jgi:hypothetical protein
VDGLNWSSWRRDQRGRNSEFDRQGRDFAPVFQRRWIGQFEPAGDVTQRMAIRQTRQHRALTRLEAPGQGRNNVAGAYQLEQLTVGIIPMLSKRVVGAIDGDSFVPDRPFRRIQASP